MNKTFALIAGAHEDPGGERQKALDGLSRPGSAGPDESAQARQIMETCGWLKPGGGPLSLRHVLVGDDEFQDRLEEFAGAGMCVGLIRLSPAEEWRGDLLLSPLGGDAEPTLRMPLGFNDLLLFNTRLLAARMVTEKAVGAKVLIQIIAMPPEESR